MPRLWNWELLCTCTGSALAAALRETHAAPQSFTSNPTAHPNRESLTNQESLRQLGRNLTPLNREDVRMDGRMAGRMDGWMAGWLDGWMDGYIHTYIHTYIHLSLVYALPWDCWNCLGYTADINLPELRLNASGRQKLSAPYFFYNFAT